MIRNKIDNTFASETQNDFLMKNMVYFFLCNLLLIALFVFSSCNRSEHGAHGVTCTDSMSVPDSSHVVMSEKSMDNLIHWADYSTLNGN